MSDFDTLKQQGLAHRGDLLGEAYTPEPAEIAPPVTPPRLEGQPEFVPGIFFGMPEETYHSIHALSTSGIKVLAGSPADYWEDSPLNPEREEQEKKDYFDFGNAIHTLVLEGEEAYEARYVIGLEKPKGVLETTDQIKARIVELGQKPLTRIVDRAAKKDDWIDQLLVLDPEAQIWDRMKAEFDANHEGAETISHKIDKRVRIGARMILAQPDLAENFTGEGYSEVSVFWYCPVTGCPMKARFDRLTWRRIVDLKSFASRPGLPIDRAVEKVIANYRYNVQHVVYDEAAEAAKRMIRLLGMEAINNYGDWEGVGPDSDEAIVEWCEHWASQPEPEFLFVFHKTTKAPVVRGKIMPREEMGIFGVTKRRVEELKRVFVANCEVFGTDRWLDAQPISHIDDEAIPQWATEI